MKTEMILMIKPLINGELIEIAKKHTKAHLCQEWIKIVKHDLMSVLDE